jgi:homoserine kinase type II
MPSQVEDVRAVLALYTAAEHPLGPLQPLGNAGGGSGASLWRYRSGRGDRVVRAWPIDGPTSGDLERIHGWLRRASALEFVPVPLEALDGRTFHERGGLLWEVAPWRPGAADANRPPASAHSRAGFAGLAAFHQVFGGEPSEGPSPGLAARWQELESLLAGGFRRWRATVLAAPDDACRRLALDWLDRAQRIAPGVHEELLRERTTLVQCQPCLRDVRADHLLFHDGQLTGLIDFGAMGGDCVSADLARLLADWVGPNPRARAEALDAYAAVRRLDERELRIITTFERSAALLGAGRWVRWHFLEARPFRDPAAVRQGLERGVALVRSLAFAPHLRNH